MGAKKFFGNDVEVPMGKRTVLIVDREKAFIDLLKRSLSSTDLVTIGTTSVGNASTLLAEHSPDFVVLDTELTGLMFIHPIRAAFPGVRVVALVPFEETVERAKALHVDEVLVRSCPSETAVAAIQQLVSDANSTPAKAAAAKAPVLKNGDRVYERYPLAPGLPKTGTVIKVYEFEGQHRCVVEYDDGTDGIFFEEDLFRAPPV